MTDYQVGDIVEISYYGSSIDGVARIVEIVPDANGTPAWTTYWGEVLKGGWTIGSIQAWNGADIRPLPLIEEDPL